MPGNVELLIEVVKQLLRADVKFPDNETVINKQRARDMALATLKAMGVEIEGL